LGNKVLLNSNELKIGNSTSATERAKNVLKIGDGSYIQIGEWEADDLLSFKASKYNFTNGNVGIGTTSPTTKLHIAGSVFIPSMSSYWIGSHGDSGNRLRLHHNGSSAYIDYCPSLCIRSGMTGVAVLDPHGNVGLGTMSPTSKLDVQGTIKTDFLKTSEDLWIGDLTANENSYGKKLYFGYPLDNSDDIYMARFNLGGDVSELRVNIGDDVYDKFIVGRTPYGQADFDPMFAVVTNGNVGIGTTAPASKLDVRGSVYIPSGQSYWIGSNTNSGNRLRLHHNGDNAYIDYALSLHIRPGANESIVFDPNGNVGLGISNPTNKLDVNGIIRAKEVKIETGWADFVFNENYNLRPLSEVNDFIRENRHLPEIPSATEIKENEGVNLGEMQVKLLQKIEELTLYAIQQQEMIDKLSARIEQLEKK
jgi:hypothetical protein